MTYKGWISTLPIVSIILLMCTCSTNRNVTGNGSQTGNAVTAMLYNPGGSPAAHAKVRFYPVNYDPQTGGRAKALATTVDSTTTDAQGNYTAKLDTGTYNVLAAGDSGVVYQDSITVIKDSTVHPPADTLGAPGSIRGKVRLQPGDDARTVFILFLGTDSWGTPDDSIGTFTVANMAKGTYRVRILTTLDAYVPKDTVLSFTAGKTDTLPHDIVLQYTGIPVPSGLTISYDTLKEIVTLNWNKPATGRTVKGYNIYRMNVDSNTTFAIINPHLITDTTYSDSTGVQDLTYEYRIAAVDTNGTEGVKSARVIVKAVSAFTLLHTIKLDSLSFDPISFTVSSDTTFYVAYNGGDNNSFVGVFEKTGHNTAIIGRGMFVQLYDVAVDSRKNIYTADPYGNKIIKFNSSGDSVSSWNASQPFRICIDRNDRIFVLIGNCSGIVAFDTSGSEISSISESFDIDAGNMVIGSEGTVYSRERSVNRAFTIDNNLSLIGNPTFLPVRDLGDVRGVDNAKRIYFRDVEFLSVYDTTGNWLTSWTPGIPYDRLFISNNIIYVLGNNNYSDVIKVFTAPF